MKQLAAILFRSAYTDISRRPLNKDTFLGNKQTVSAIVRVFTHADLDK